MGHLNLISGQTHQTNTASVSGKVVNGSVIANIKAGFDDCGTAPRRFRCPARTSAIF